MTDKKMNTLNQVSAILGQDPLLVLEEIRELNKTRSKLAAAYDIAKEQIKQSLSSCKENIRKEHDKITESRLEDMARVSEEHKSMLNAYREILEAYHESENEYWFHRSRFDYLMKSLDFARAEAILHRK